jgi:glycosyltransferase involved in cell wall biosynthesis
VKVLLVGTGAHPIPPPGYGAVERILFEYGQALAQGGTSAQIVNEPHEGRALGEYRFALRLPGLLRKQEFDVLHASTPVVANRLSDAGFSFVYTSHSRHWFWRASWRHSWGYWLERRAVRRAAATVALTAEVETEMRRALPPGWSRPLPVIPFGVNVADYAPDWDRRTGRRALGVGLVAPLKRWEIAAAALQGTGIRLRVAGPIVDAPYAARLRSTGDGVELLGEVPEGQLRSLYAESDLLVHPSAVEVLPRSVLEAMASGLPVVGSPVVASLLSGDRTGFAPPAGASPEALVGFFRQAAERLVADPGLGREMGNAARAHAQRAFSWERVVAAHLEMYRSLGVG